MAVCCVSLLVLSVAGCGGAPTYDTGLVTGTVTLDGSPLPSARIQFQPDGGSPSSGLTDSSGKYKLKYTRSTMGAEPGNHSVSISTFNEGDSDAEPPVASSPETVPTKYNSDTELTAEVVKGPNTHNFDLKTEGGTVVQPEDEGGEGEEEGE
ncbi:MAG: carboxypeptidase regulatory-like domain-containing protein [Pirellulales bacterium]